MEFFFFTIWQKLVEKNVRKKEQSIGNFAEIKWRVDSFACSGEKWSGWLYTIMEKMRDDESIIQKKIARNN